MARKSKIRWRESDLQELTRAINNFNQKLYRAGKRDPSLAEYLPARVSKKAAIGSIETRADFKRTVESLRRFSERGAETPIKSSRGAKATQWEVDEFKRKQARVNRQREKERKAIEEKEVKIAGKGTRQTRAEMGSIKENALKPSKKTFNNLSQKEWELATKSIDKQLNSTDKIERMQKMRENYLKGLTENGFLDDSPELEQMIRGMDVEKFYETVQTDETATFFFYKDPIAYKTRLEYLTETWSAASKGAGK